MFGKAVPDIFALILSSVIFFDKDNIYIYDKVLVFVRKARVQEYQALPEHMLTYH